jgi:predicted amidohydrolase YtcJ
MVDLALVRGRIAAIGRDLAASGEEFDCAGHTLLPGLHDHHLHILALAARRWSVDLSALRDPAAVAEALARAPPGPGGWLRATGYDERALPDLPDTALLDRWSPARPLRLQDRTGALWVLNSAALARLAHAELPPGAERDAAGQPTGRFWREDAWLSATLPRHAPDLTALGAEFAALGLTALTDAGASNGPAEAATLAAAHLSGQLPQRLTLMGSEALPPGPGYTRGPLKLLIDERDPPSSEALAARIATARAQHRAVAAHCVTELELALYLAALELAGGARPGDRIEHGGMIPAEAVPVIAKAGLTVVTNPAFLHDRGDRYAATIPAERQPDLYRVASLIAAGIPLLAGSDAPYASPDPWLSMRSARDRLSAGGQALAPAERIGARAALALHAAGPIEPGAPAELVLCTGTFADVLADLSAERVRATIIGGRLAHARA